MEATVQPSSPGRGLHPLRSLQRHWRKSLMAAIFVVLAGVPFVWLKGGSTFSAETVFQVYATYQKTMYTEKDLELQSNTQYREFVNHMARSVLRYDIVERAVDDLAGLGCLASETRRKCIERLQRVISIIPIADTYMVRVGLQTDAKGEADKILNKIMEIFLKTIREEQVFGMSERMKKLNARETEAKAEINKLELQRGLLAGQLGLTTFTENTSNPYDSVLIKMREQLAMASIQRSTAQAALQAFETKLEVPIQAGRSLLDMRLQDNGLQLLRNEVIKRNEELSRLISGMEPRHPAAASARREKKELATRMALQEREFDKLAMKNSRARLQSSLQQAIQVERDLTASVAQFESKASSFAMMFQSATQISRQVRALSQEINEINERQNIYQMERDSLGFVRLLTPALPAVMPQGVGRVKLGLGVLLASLGIFLLMPLGIDMLDRRIMVVSDAERGMGIPAAAWFVEVTGASSAMLLAAQYKRFASTLLRNRSTGADNVFAFSSVRVGGGCTGVVMHLAKQLHELGTRVLVVDANTMATNSKLSHPGPGLTDILAGRIGIGHVAVRDSQALPGIDLVTLGTLRAGGLKRIDRLHAALEAWQAQYDMVLIDLPPLLPSADAELMVDAVKQIFMVVETMTVTKAEVVQVRDQFTRQGPQAVGLVVNRVPMELVHEKSYQHMIEAITGGRFTQFMSLANLSLQVELLKLRIQRWRSNR
jgi:succinoglycan biosynthesis transport protein ExoP